MIRFPIIFIIIRFTEKFMEKSAKKFVKSQFKIVPPATSAKAMRKDPVLWAMKNLSLRKLAIKEIKMKEKALIPTFPKTAISKISPPISAQSQISSNFFLEDHKIISTKTTSGTIFPEVSPGKKEICKTTAKKIIIANLIFCPIKLKAKLFHSLNRKNYIQIGIFHFWPNDCFLK